MPRLSVSGIFSTGYHASQHQSPTGADQLAPQLVVMGLVVSSDADLTPVLPVIHDTISIIRNSKYHVYIYHDDSTPYSAASIGNDSFQSAGIRLASPAGYPVPLAIQQASIYLTQPRAGGGEITLSIHSGIEADTGGYLEVAARANDPARGFAINSGLLYTKDVAGVTQLFFRRSNNTVIQIT